MLLAGLQKNSLIDFPGKISCVVFLTGCNFSCPFCHNPELALGLYPQRITIAQLFDFLIPRRLLLDAVVISGGEPCLHPGLAGLCRRIRQTGLAIKLDTNGSRCDVLAQLLRDGLIDYVAMDVKTDFQRYAPPLCDSGHRESVRRSIRILLQSDVAYEFRTTCVRPFVDARAILQIVSVIRGARRYTLQTFRPGALLRGALLQQPAPGFSTEEMAHLRALAAPFVQHCQVR